MFQVSLAEKERVANHQEVMHQGPGKSIREYYGTIAEEEEADLDLPFPANFPPRP
jgi:hypothetical protein